MARGYNLGLAIGLGVLLPLVGCAGTEDDMMDGAAAAGTGEAGEEGQGQDASAGADQGDGGGAGTGGADGGGGEGPGDGAAGEGDAGTGGAEGDGDSTGTGSECETGLVTPSEVVLIGDSYFEATRVALDLYVHARLAGSLGPNETYRQFYQGGTQMGNGQIPAQYDAAKNSDPSIDTVIMTGGGNDVLIGAARDCLQNPPPNAQCVDRLEDVFSAATGLLDQMAADGVENAIYFFYPHLPEGGFIDGAKNETLDYAYPFVREVCESAQGINCIFVDTRDAFEGHQDEYFLDDGIHPNDAGAQVIADLLWETMVDNCVAQ